MRIRNAVVTLVGGSALASAALAQEQPENTDELGSIVVSAPQYVSTGSRAASKSDIPLVETPQSVTVVSRDMIDLLNWTSLNESVRYAAGTTGEAFGPDERYDWLQVRGFDPVQFIDGVQAPIGSVNNTGTDLYGSESVEVLKGPASVLYGQTPPGGIVNMTSRRPRDEFGGELELQGGEYNAWQVSGDLTGPITDTISARFTALYRDRETQVDFLTSERLFISPAITFKLTPDTQLTILANYQDDDLENQTTGFLPAFGTELPNPLGKVPVGRNLGETGYNSFKREQWSAGYDFSHSFSDRFTIQQNLKYFDVKVDSRAVFGTGLLDAGFDGTPDDFRTVTRSDFPFNEVIRSLSADTRGYFDFDTGGLQHKLLFGFDYRDYDGYSEFGFAAAPSIDLFDPVYDAVIPPATIFPFIDETRDQRGVYLQDQIKLGQLIFTMSGRNDWVKRSPEGGDSVDQEEFTYRVGVNYVFDNGFAPYVQTATSFQPLTGATFDGVPFEPTTGDQVEAGIKFDGREFESGLNLFGSLSVYQITQENVPTPDPDNVFFSIQAGEVEVQGVELEIAARLRERMTFNLAVTKLDTEVTETSGTDLGNELVAVPDLLVSALADYTFQDGPLAGFGFGLGVRHRGEMFGDGANEWQSDAVTVYDAILHYDTRDWRIAVNGSNFTDEIYVDRCSSAANCFYGTRRLVTGSVTRKF
ncbi:MAG TPA: TonB-dependent siderophore receptor [Steroidobacteraceae bacterium]|nr:TonB-dependent siderophore receptor [Steroidobacteraceae bacterium]